MAKVNAPEQGVLLLLHFSPFRCLVVPQLAEILKQRFTPFFIEYKSNEYKLPKEPEGGKIN